MHVVKDSTASARFTMARNVPRIEMMECEENEFVNLPLFSPSRAPLHSITDPSQLQKATHLSESDLVQKFEGTRTQHYRTLGSEKRFEVLESRAGNASGMHDSNPKTFSRNGKSRSEPNSAQSTPTRNGARVSLGGGCATGARVVQSFGGRGMSSFSRIPRGISMVDPVCYAETPHFELNEDHSFWKEHNVQVLIRIRPLSTMERATQGYGKCLKQESSQTLVWLGHPETRFTFDHVASDTISQENLFRIAGLPMVENCLSGYNSCVFAYGQTGSGKTYTMMGEISEPEGSLNEDCGVTARIFEYLFSRIKMEEEGRRDEKLKFSCKCSFLEIYNEQITDLLEPSSTNLQLREDLGKGVYVENLVEYNVRNVNDVLKLLLQGTANRKIAATHMNSESSRSHSVFTCTIESLWERDSLTHFRFARLNLVDLAGSERQKSSGAEGDRLKEAANINKSLSTLGLVIMSLVDLAHGKHRHVPYRDSRLTFLLQDSLGGNSKTMIIANVSPSTCSTNETLSTLKFAQRAKLIQNNAKVNEDASGDVTALQQEIRKLKVQLSSLMKNQNSCGTLSDCAASLEESKCSGTCEVAGETIQDKCHCQMQNSLRKKVKTMKDILIGALRREKIADTAIQKSEAEIERIDSLARDMEEDVKRIKEMLSCREEKVGEMEFSLTGSLTTKDYLIEENKNLKGEIELLQARINKNPELTRSALENTKLREQLRRYQNFYEHGERELLLAEVAGLRDQLLDLLGAKEDSFTRHSSKENEVDKELEDCRNMNSNLIRELDEIQAELGVHMKFDLTPSDFVESSTSGAEQAETMPISSKPRECVAVSESKDCSNNNNESGNPDGHETWLIDESQDILEENKRSRKMLTNKSNTEREAFPGQEASNRELSDMVNSKDNASMKPGGGFILPFKLEKLIEDLKEARKLNCKYEKEYESHLSQQQDIEAVREQVETETARTILELQEEVVDLQSDFQIRICTLIHENQALKDTITAKEAEIRALNQDWEKATLELTNFIVDGSKFIKDASVQIESIICSFPHVNAWIGDYVEKAAKVCIKKEETIVLLQKSLEDARILLAEMDLKLNSLKGATIALNEFQLAGNAVSTEEAFCLNSEIDRMSNEVDTPESDLKAKQYSMLEAERRAEAAFSVTKWLSDSLQVSTRVDINRTTCSRSLAVIDDGTKTSYEKIDEIALSGIDIRARKENYGHVGCDLDIDIHAFLTEIKVNLADSEKDFLEMYTYCKRLVHHLIREVNEIRCELRTLKGGHGDFQISLKPVEPCKPRTRNQHQMMESVNDQTAEESGTLSSSFASPTAERISDTSFSKGGYSSEATYPKDDKLLTSSSELSNHRWQPDWILNAKCQGGASSRSDAQEMHTSAALIAENGSVHSVDYGERMKAAERPLTRMMERAETECKCSNAPSSEVGTGLIQRMDLARSFFQRFEAANATMKEADLTICELVTANEKSKYVIGRWSQTQEELMAERKILMADFEHIKSTLSSSEQENQILLNQTQFILVEMENSVSLLEEKFRETKRGVVETLEALFSSVLIAGKELLHLISNSKLSVEQIVSETMEREFTMYATYQCHIGKLIDQILDQGKQVINPPFARQENLQPMEMKAIGYSAEVEATRRLNGAYRADFVKDLENEEAVQSHESLIYENLYLKKELERKEALFEGLLFDFRLLQESASNKRDIKDETDELIDALCKVQQELDMKASQVHDLSVHNDNLENVLNELQTDLFTSKSDLKQGKERIQILEEQNNALGVLVRDLCLEKAAAEEKLEEQNVLVKSLEKEILHLTTTAENQLLSSVKTTEENLRKACDEKDQLVEEICSLNDKLELAYAIVDEKEAAAAEARQESEASKLYAEQKEEEVRILETSVEELERTVNILERRVYDMDEEVKRHRTTQESLETELQALRQRLFKFGNFNGTVFSTNESTEEYESQISRSKELQDADCQMQVLQKEVAEQNKEIKQLKDYISEILLHSEAQASAYQEKYKTLEAMVRDFKSEESSSSAAGTMSHKTEKSAIRSRGSSSPFRCLVGMVQQMNLEKDQELTMSRLRVEELESLVAAKHKEVCTLNTRLAAADSMTHDVIRDLLGVKMDITSYADLVDQHQVQRVVEEAQQHAEEIISKEQEIINLKKHIDALVKERESCMSELNKKDTDVLATQISLDQLQERVQLLYMQNEMLKNDKSNLLKRVAELDRTVRDTHAYSQHVPQTTKDSVSFKLADTDYTKRLENAQKLLSHANNELAKYRKTSNNHPSTKSQGQNSGTRYR